MTGELIPDFDKKLKPTKKQLLILKNIRICKKVTDYINFRLNKNSTKRAFASHIRNYFIHLEISNIGSYFKDPRRMSNGKRLDYTDKIEQDIQSFNNSFKNYSGSHRLSNLSAIRKLLEYNRIDLGNSFWEGIRKAGSNAERETDIIGGETLFLGNPTLVQGVAKNQTSNTENLRDGQRRFVLRSNGY